MNIRSVDLNLLVALDALLSELHVTRAAERVGLSQPAMSNALSRLRHVFKDDLLVRTPHGMQATPRARELTGPVRQVLRSIERVLDGDTRFDPASSDRRFAVRLSDLLGRMLLPALVADLAASAPAIRFDVVHLPPHHTTDALERDEIDLAVSMGLGHAASIQSEPLMQDRMVCVMRREHPAALVELTPDAFLAAKHLKVSMSPTDLRFADDVLSRLGKTRNVVLNLPHWMLVPYVLERSDLISVMPRSFALTIAGETLATRDLPLPSPSFDWTIYWHRRNEGSDALRWLRRKLETAARAARAYSDDQ